jgi:putative sterol carrier protein
MVGQKNKRSISLQGVFSAMDKATTIQQVFDAMPERFNKDAAAGVDAVFQFDLTGPDGGKYWVKVSNQEMELNSGEHTSPTITIVANSADYLKLVNGEIAAMQAFMQGKVKVKGNMGLAMKLQSIFGLG